MGVSIYYSFSSKKDLIELGALDELSDQWNAEFASDLSEESRSEPWTWYEPKHENGENLYEGATKISMDVLQGGNCVIQAVKLLSALRNTHGGDGWSVNLDDFEIPWDEEEKSFILA